MNILHFNNFAHDWVDGLPIGNGRLAAMMWGDEETDILSLNHEWLWTGNFKERECEEGAHFLPYVRDYLKKGQNFKATALAAVAFGGNGGISPLKRRMDSYQPAGEIVLKHKKFNNIDRVLDMRKGIAQSNKSDRNENLTFTAFCHCTQNIIIAKWNSDNSFSAELSYNREDVENVKTELTVKDKTIEFYCDNYKGVGFKVKINFETDGNVDIKNDVIYLDNATYFTLFCDIGSEHLGIEKELDSHVLHGDFDDLKKSHESSFSKIMDKWTLELEDENTKALEKMPINFRKQRMKDGYEDAQLVSIFALYGVYLMVSGSILAELPLNLQGKWNRDVMPKWNSDYHLNINLQMNYWFTDMLGMDTYTRQMTDYVLRLLPKARIAAKRLYGCRGVLYPLNSDIWGNVTPESYNYSVWISAAGWLALHFYNNYLYTGDKQYLREYAYPFFKEIAEFYEDYIEIDENGTAQLMPSQSPENKYEGCGYFPVSMCISAAMDVQVAYEALSFAANSADVLNIDKKQASHWRFLRDSLPDFRIGKDSRLLEWDSDDKIEIEKGHRHVSHLYGVYPASLFTPQKRLAQFNAARKSLDYRLAHSGGYTGWSSAWSACLFARFEDGEKVNENMHRLLTQQSSTTMLDLHPDYYPINKQKNYKPKDEPLLFTKPQENPPMIFQIDGNLGATAALLEAFVQQREGKIYLLPAISKAWKSATFSGIRVQGGHILSFIVKDSKISYLEVTLGFAKTAVFANFNDDGSDLLITGIEGERRVIV